MYSSYIASKTGHINPVLWKKILQCKTHTLKGLNMVYHGSTETYTDKKNLYFNKTDIIIVELYI